VGRKTGGAQTILGDQDKSRRMKMRTRFPSARSEALLIDCAFNDVLSLVTKLRKNTEVNAQLPSSEITKFRKY
jgi:hypothetical protein